LELERFSGSGMVNGLSHLVGPPASPFFFFLPLLLPLFFPSTRAILGPSDRAFFLHATKDSFPDRQSRPCDDSQYALFFPGHSPLSRPCVALSRRFFFFFFSFPWRKASLCFFLVGSFLRRSQKSFCSRFFLVASPFDRRGSSLFPLLFLFNLFFGLCTGHVPVSS